MASVITGARPAGVSRRRWLVGRGLLVLAAVAALLAAVDAMAALASAPAGTAMLDAWRAFGLVLFAGLFALLARDPWGYPGILELAIAHKVALAVIAAANPTATDAGIVLAADGALAAVLVTAYALLGSHRAWRRAPDPAAPATGRA